MVFGPIRTKLGWGSEPYRPSTFGSASREACQFFTKSGWCKWGDECRYEHVAGPDTPVGASPAFEKSGEVCQFFAKSGWCKYGDKCKHEHVSGTTDAVPREPCNFFSKSGWCQYGDSCKYEHVQGHGLDTQFAPPKADVIDAECCQFFAKAGWCKFGDECRYQHIFDAGQAPLQEKSGEVCQFFAKSGWCKFGDQCKHEHVGEPKAKPSGNGEAREPCQFFSKTGWCQYGNSCKYLHLPGSGPGNGLTAGPARSSPRADSGAGKKQEICNFFAKSGWCKHGDACHFIHIDRANSTGMELSAAQAESAAAALLETPGMQKAEALGVDLSEDAVKALLTIPSTHASELLDTVAEKHESLRDPSNYVVSTIARGYVPRGF